MSGDVSDHAPGTYLGECEQVVDVLSCRISKLIVEQDVHVAMLEFWRHPSR